MEGTSEITLQEIFEILWAKVGIILLVTLLGGTVAFCVSQYVIVPTYTSRVSMYVNNSSKSENSIANINDINAAQKLVNTYVEILKSDTVLREVIEEANLNYTKAQLREFITARSVSGTEIFEVNVTTENSQEAALIANTIAEVAPDAITRVVKAGSVELIDRAEAPETPTSPNTMLNTMIGLMLGGVISVLGVLVAAMLDNHIKSEEELKKNYDFPIIGAIPSLDDALGRIK